MVGPNDWTAFCDKLRFEYLHEVIRLEGQWRKLDFGKDGPHAEDRIIITFRFKKVQQADLEGYDKTVGEGYRADQAATMKSDNADRRKMIAAKAGETEEKTEKNVEEERPILEQEVVGQEMGVHGVEEPVEEEQEIGKQEMTVRTPEELLNL